MAAINALGSYLGSVRQRKAIIRSLAYHLPVLLLSLLMVYPILWMFASSFKGPA